MGTKNLTLIDRLGDIVDKIHLKEVKSIITQLTNINAFKHSMQHDLSEEVLYKTITAKLKNEFGINTLKTAVINDNIETVLYHNGSKKELKCSYTQKVSNETNVKIEYCCQGLNEYQQLTLNTYLNEVVHLIYIQYVLNTLKRTSHLDSLTKLSNRIAFQQKMKTLVPLAKREDMNLGLLIINIDRFRAVNDEHGNAFGDQFLKLYAKTIKKIVRSSDLLVRFGGGEFLVLLINVDTKKRVLEIAHNIKDKLAETHLVSPNGDHFKKTVCIGVSTFPEDGDDIHTIIKNAEIALSDAKDQGRNIVKSFQKDDISTIDFF